MWKITFIQGNTFWISSADYQQGHILMNIPYISSENLAKRRVFVSSL